MKSFLQHLLLLTLFVITLSACTQNKNQITIFSASSLTEVVKETIDTFETTFGKEVVAVFAGSNHLAAQLRDGAPADIFLTADTDLFDGLMYIKKEANFAKNFLLIAKSAKDLDSYYSPDDLNRSDLIVAICSVSVPCGGLTKSKFSDIDADTYELNVKAVLARISSGEADLGVVYATDVESEPKVVVAWPQKLECPCISYGAAAMTESGVDFIEFLMSPKVQQIFRDYGFKI